MQYSKMLLALPSFSSNYGTKPQDHFFSHFTWYKVAEKRSKSIDTIVSNFAGDKGIERYKKFLFEKFSSF